jgi:hypothetical protein
MRGRTTHMELSSFPTMVMADYNLYRLNDYIFFGFMVIAVVFCLVHAARRAFRQPIPNEIEEK